MTHMTEEACFKFKDVFRVQGLESGLLNAAYFFSESTLCFGVPYRICRPSLDILYIMCFGSEVPAQSRPSVVNESAKPSVAWEPYQ